MAGWTAEEMMTVAAARLLKDGTVCFVGIGLPSAAANLARLTHAPEIVLIYESGTIGAKPSALPLSIGGVDAQEVEPVIGTGREESGDRFGAGEIAKERKGPAVIPGAPKPAAGRLKYRAVLGIDRQGAGLRQGRRLPARSMVFADQQDSVRGGSEPGRQNEGFTFPAAGQEVPGFERRKIGDLLPRFTAIFAAVEAAKAEALARGLSPPGWMLDTTQEQIARIQRTQQELAAAMAAAPAR